MLSCSAIISRTGHFNTGNSLVIASKAMNIRRQISNISRNKFLGPRLWDLPIKQIGQVHNIHTTVLTCRVILKSVDFFHSKTLCVRNINAYLKAQCSTCTTNVKEPVTTPQISEDDFGPQAFKKKTEFKAEKIFEDEPDEHSFGGHRHHLRKEHEIKISEIEGLYPNPKDKCNSIFMSVGGQLKTDKPLDVEFEATKRGMWTCHYQLKWPQKMTISAVAKSKNGAGKLAALKCLQWLHNNGKMKNGHPIVYESKVVHEMLRKATALEIEPEMLKNMQKVLARYDSDIKHLIDNSNSHNIADIKDISIAEDIRDPVGRSFPESWQPANMLHRNDTLRNRLLDRPQRQSHELPISEYRNQIIEEIQNSRVLLIKGDTGCGKTTQVPQYIMEFFESQSKATDCNMIVAQPRRISAISLAERIASERAERVGDVVGYQVRLKQILPSTPGGILFCTTGILLRKMQQNPNLEGVSHVILDEAHERTINTDMLLVLLKRALQNNPKLKVVVMSATINADLFQQFFDCNVVEVPGRTFPVKMNFLEDVENLGIRSSHQWIGEQEFPDRPLVDAQMIGQLVCWITKKKPPGAILVFLPGWGEIVKVKKYLEEHSTRNSQRIIIPVHSRMSYQDQQKIFGHPPEGWRKIVLATDIAETGITVTDVVYVVDSATQKAMKYHEKKGISSVETQYASQANIQQRKGRAGRVQPGESYHLITRSHFDTLPVDPLPEVLRSSLEKTVLDCKTYSNEKAETFLGSMPQPPTLSAVRQAIKDLRELGALDDKENLTALGKRIALFTLHPKLSKALVYSSIFNCVSPMVTIVSAMSADSEIFAGTLHDKVAIRRTKQKYHPASDHLSLRWIYSQWESHSQRGREAATHFCKRTNLFPDRMFTLSKVRDLHADGLVQCRMLNSLEVYDDTGETVNEFADLDELVRAVLLAGLDQFLHHRDFDIRKQKIKKGTSSFTMEDGNRATLTPESVNFKRETWPSPFLTYVRRQHSEERRTTLIRETSIVSPITVLLFNQAHVQGHLRSGERDSENSMLDLTITGRKNFRLTCSREVAATLLQFRDAMWSIVRYLIERQGLVENGPGTNLHSVENFKEYMLQVLVQILSDAAEPIDSPDKSTSQSTSKYSLRDDEESD
ncbi:ATP-dependent RNA helicase DHX30-like [Venturia canescens]|uniref:ATP-dependent RNA helicase DHX30-like n=1 Tax=Venturia canescens TaxID=32260 RepID=UPI001C9C755B|nr:ATP-dependent RNA helicase DHX30-like [Venturia canescens]